MLSLLFNFKAESKSISGWSGLLLLIIDPTVKEASGKDDIDKDDEEFRWEEARLCKDGLESLLENNDGRLQNFNPAELLAAKMNYCSAGY